MTLLGVPFNGIGTPPDTENPAEALRGAGLAGRLRDRGHRVSDLGDLPIPTFSGRRDPATGVLNQGAWRQVTASLANALDGRLRPEQPVLVLGGDCAIMSGVAAALHASHRGFGIVYVDGHADYRMPADSPTGEPADLVLTALTGRIPGVFGDDMPCPLAGDDEIVVFGHRDPDRIAESAIATFDRVRLREMGVTRAAHDAMRRLAGQPGQAWVHLDVDVLDPSVMPAVVFPERDGLTIGETEELLATAFRMLPVVGVSVVCYHPQLDADGSAARVIVDFLADALPA